MHLDGRFPDAELPRNHFIGRIQRRPRDDFPFPRRQFRIKRFNVSFLPSCLPCLHGRFHGLCHHGDEYVGLHWFFQKIRSPVAHRMHRHRHVAVSRQEYERQRRTAALKNGLHLQSRQSRHSDIRHRASRARELIVFQKGLGRRIRLDGKSPCFQKKLLRHQKDFIIVNETHERLFVHTFFSVMFSSKASVVKRTVSPPSGLRSKLSPAP